MMKKQSRPKPYIKKDRFYNDADSKRKRFVFETFCMLCGSCFYRVKDFFKDRNHWIANDKSIERSTSLAITWIGHSTFLIQVGGVNILVDPIFGAASLLFPRILPSGISLDDLPPIDIILISHNHRDHMELATLRALQNNNNVTILVPQGLKQWFDARGFNQVHELTWWQSHLSSSHNDIRCTCLPAKHWSQRAVLDKNKTLWSSWMIECNGRTIYFAGDTIYSDHFSSIAHEFSIDVALLPIAPCEPKRWLQDAHLNPHEAGQAFLDLQATHFIPMHWGTFHFGIEPYDLAINRMQDWHNQHSDKLAGKKMHFPKVGQRLTF